MYDQIDGLFFGRYFWQKEPINKLKKSSKKYCDTQACDNTDIQKEGLISHKLSMSWNPDTISFINTIFLIFFISFDVHIYFLVCVTEI